MPGTRLTHQDRADIAEGLAEGLTLAEIAKRLDRPPSTITREVARNGGAREYRPGQAQLAATRRARRRPVHRLSAPPETGQDAAAVRDFTERFTELMVRSGMPGMMAKVLTCLYTTDSGSLTAADLVRRLQVSPASISAAVGFLEEQELITRERDGRARRDRYLIGNDVWYRAMLASAQVNGEMAGVAREGARLFGAHSPAGQRLEDVGEFLTRVYENLLRSAEDWRAVRADRQSGDSPG
ncbi:DNA-binding transcriptional regulator GbsR (MarR family) [Crossiella equi]|uniref:DNA-binding transcriptional regulator GbsR (MarR family) n=1 Tax=Crossiella equi TaxID=130796 RepID=A0ABS5APJ0_9PSEU|nr:helix-turn-helix domain-containing protein [Crossiella equi]MBP2478492.1 DNA-binding transcriptional regulator GbsR (MarR family) [Crossiella equi]